MIIVRPRGRRDYVLESERNLPTDKQTVFVLEDLTEKDRVAIMDTLRVGVSDSGSTGVSGTGSRVYRAVRAGLRGWRNLKYGDGTDVPFVFEGQYPTDETLGALPWAVKQELADAINASTFLDEDDRKKSAP